MIGTQYPAAFRATFRLSAGPVVTVTNNGDCYIIAGRSLPHVLDVECTPLRRLVLHVAGYLRANADEPMQDDTTRAALSILRNFEPQSAADLERGAERNLARARRTKGDAELWGWARGEVADSIDTSVRLARANARAARIMRALEELAS